MENNIENYNESIFESIKHINEYGDEFWYARELQTVLGYKQWRRFYDVIERAKIACENSDYEVSDHLPTLAKSWKLVFQKKAS